MNINYPFGHKHCFSTLRIIRVYIIHATFSNICSDIEHYGGVNNSASMTEYSLFRHVKLTALCSPMHT